ncbi:MAG: NUDIX hydrolase [Rickettsiales bacterium]|jgi:ADP-ribose pyrophosphatase YjhB (NUDIX family)|nr:NUDIX hydrolase [Rickettsiales bacterium]
MTIPIIKVLTEDSLGLPVSKKEITRQRVTAHVILSDDQDRIALFCPHGKTGYRLPGGAVEEGESYAIAAVREVMEEIQAVIDVDPEPICQIVSIKKAEGLKQISFILTAKLREIESNKQDIKWLTSDAAIDLLRNQKPKAYKKTFRQARDLTALEYTKGKKI